MHIIYITTLIFLILKFPLCVKGQVVSFFDRELTVNEGDQFNVRITKSGTNAKPFIVIVQVQNDVDGDFVGDSQVAQFDAGASGVAIVTFTIKDDNIPEGPKIYYLRMYLLDKSINIGSPDQLQITIPANDDAYGVFSLNEVSPMIVQEHLYNYIVQVKVKREISYYDRVLVNFMLNTNSSSTAKIGEDISPARGVVTFQPEQKEAFIELQVLADDIPENSESFFVSLTYTSPDARVIKSVLEVIIAANDAPVHFTKAEYRFEEGPSARIVAIDITRGIMEDAITQTGPINVQVSVDYNFISGSAVFDSDYSATSGTLIFSPGETKKTISFTIIDDTIPEIEEDFSVRLLNLKGDAVLYVPNVAKVIINANDNPNGIIGFKPDTSGEAPSMIVNEDSITSVTFIVERTAGTFGEVKVSWIITRDAGGSAPVTEDVGPEKGTLIFANGANQATISLTVVQDNIAEPAEMFVITLQPDSVTGSAVVEGFTQALLLIEDSDNIYGTVEFGPSSNQKLITNQSPRLLQLSLSRTGGLGDDLEANMSAVYDDGTNHDEDIFVTSSKTVNLPAGESTVIVNFDLLQSTFLLIGGKFQATIMDLKLKQIPRYGAFNSPKIGARQQITVVVSQNEANGETGFFNTTNLVVDEPVSGVTKVSLLVSREGLSGQANIKWSISGKDVTASDVDALQGTLVMQQGMSEAYLVIGIKADGIPEVTEFINVTLDSIEPSDTQRLRAGSISEIITVNANDNPGGVLQFSPKMNLSYTISEGDDPIEVIVERTGGDLTESEVQYSIVPSGNDQFYGATNILVFRPGTRQASALILAIKDGIPELPMKYTLVLTPVGNPPSVLGNHTSIEITINGSDNPYGIICIAADFTTVYTDEGQLGEQKNISVLVQRNNGAYGTITVPWALSPIPQGDLIPSSGTIIFQPGQDLQNITLSVVNDAIPEGDETYALQLSTPEGGALLGTPMVATIIIQENDNPVEFVDPVKYVTEPQTVSLVIKRQGRLDKKATIHYRTLDGSASYIDGDYIQIQPQEITFQVGQQDLNIIVTVLDDNTPEGNETFYVQLFDVGGDLITTTNSTATIVIMANDQAYGVFSFAQPADAQVAEGSTVFFNVIRSLGNYGSVRVYWELRSLNNIILQPGDDFQVTSGQMDFSPQENQKPLGISPRADNSPEVNEQFLLVLTQVEVLNGISSGNLASLANNGTVAIVTVTSSNDPNGLMAFTPDSRDLKIAEDFYIGSESSTQATFTVERRQGTQDEVKVLWEIFSDQLGANLPVVHDLLFSGQWPSSVQQMPLQQRPGTSTPVAYFSGLPGQYITVAAEIWPSIALTPTGFSLSAWLQPAISAGGYIVAYCSSNGTIHFLSLRIVATAAKTGLILQVSTELQSNQQLNVETNAAIVDGKWHHIFISVGSGEVKFYLNGQSVGSGTIIGSTLLKNPDNGLVGACLPGSDLYTGYMQDVRIFQRALDASLVTELYQSTPYADLTLISGILTYAAGVQTQSFIIGSRQDIEEEGREMFAVILLDTTGGATLSSPDSRTTLSGVESN